MPHRAPPKVKVPTSDVRRGDAQNTGQIAANCGKIVEVTVLFESDTDTVKNEIVTGIAQRLTRQQFPV